MLQHEGDFLVGGEGGEKFKDLVKSTYHGQYDKERCAAPLKRFVEETGGIVTMVITRAVEGKVEWKEEVHNLTKVTWHLTNNLT